MAKSLDFILECMEDVEMESHISRTTNYSVLMNLFQTDGTVDSKIADRVLGICSRDLTNNLQYSMTALAVVSLILKKIQEGQCENLPNLLPSALAIVKMVVKADISKKFQVKKESVIILLSYPDEILIDLVSNHSKEVLAVFDHSLNPGRMDEDLCKIPAFLTRLLQILPPTKKTKFVKDGLYGWFCLTIPTFINEGAINVETLKETVPCLELLADTIMTIDYSSNPDWDSFMKSICNTARYPNFLKRLVETGNDYWHRLWIIFIKLLKEDITKVHKGGVSPINALLPVVELAFKLDTRNRCRAFQCWNHLIDNFATNLNEALLNKRLKLLIIPLKLNNAKVEETIRPKFNTWWHLIRQFQNKMDKLTDAVLIPFLHFCFGKYNGSKSGLAPGQVAPLVASQCVEVFVEIVGHANCEGCVVLPRLKNRLINTKLLVEYWNDWLHSLTVAIRSQDCDSDIMKQRITCLWTSFILTIGELPDNQIRADLFSELLKSVGKLIELSEVTSAENLQHTVFYILIKSLFTDEPNIRQLLKTKSCEGPLYMILDIINNPALDGFYSNQNPEKLLPVMKSIMSTILDPPLTQAEEIVTVFLQKLQCNGNYSTLWVALSEAICESEYILSPGVLGTVVMWPILKMNRFSMKKTERILWYKWYTLYNDVHTFISSDVIDAEITKILSGNATTNKYLELSASLALLKQKLVNIKYAESDFVEAELTRNIISKMEDSQLKMFLPILIDTLVLVINKAIEYKNNLLAQRGMEIVNLVIIFINEGLKTRGNVTKMNIIIFENLFIAIDTFFQEDSYVELQPVISDTLIECITLLDKNHPLKKYVLSILKTFMSKNKDSDEGFYNSIKTVVDLVETQENAVAATENNPDTNQNDFPVPVVKETKKSKKKEPSIVNTVVENGEEYVVVKSHWKFNPRKLTEGQKDKLKRKREDIPALYQDLSQSQDEFKLTTWKTDSQDASSTISKSNSNTADNDVTAIFKNIPSTDVVPHIMETILSDAVNKDKDKTKEEPNVNSIDKTENQERAPVIKDPKTPRLALKDRVFKNVRNLIEKSGLQNECTAIPEKTGVENQSKFTHEKSSLENQSKSIPEKSALENQGKSTTEKSILQNESKPTSDLDVIEIMNQTVNDLKTPKRKTKTDKNVTNSAPSKIGTRRPSRPKKTPKKFEDTEIFALKKKRRALGCSPQLDMEIDNETQEVTKLINEPNKEIEKTITESELPVESLEIVELVKDIETNTCEDDNKKPSETPIQSSQTPEENNAKTDVDKTEEKIDTQEKDTENTPKEQVVSNVVPVSSSQTVEEISTPKPAKKKSNDDQSTLKKKRSRIEKQLLIDMVEGHPVLQSQSEKRVTRKQQPNDNISKRRKSLIEKSNKIKAELQKAELIDSNIKDKTSLKSLKQKSESTCPTDSQSLSESSQDLPMSEDVIESSQDSTITTISVRSASKKKVPVVSMNKANPLAKCKATETQKLIEELNNDNVAPLKALSSNDMDDIELPKNKTMVEENEVDLTENMDTQPLDSSEVVVINDDEETPIVINTEETVGKETQELAEADTLPMDVESLIPPTVDKEINDDTVNLTTENNVQDDFEITHVPTQDGISSIPDTAEAMVDVITESSNTDSPFKDEVQRKNEFLNNTIEISPIKTMSPIREKKTPSPEANKDYVVIKLTSPVQSNGEPYNEKCDSPEIFTDDKVSPDKRNQSPPRKEVTVTNTSPSSSLSLKKRPQMRFNGRAAQMLGLCVPDNEADEETKRSSTPAKRNLKTMYNVGDNENRMTNDESEDSETFLKFKRALPTSDCSPAGPILKRKLADITDDSTVSPASKRKRVSFHDPPVSTTVAVQKYIEPCGIRSPQNSAIKRQEKQLRALNHHIMKSPKRLDKVFRLENVLTKAAESFSDSSPIQDTISLLDETPAAEIIQTSELNDTDPICPELINCKDPIDNIASDLSSPTTKTLLIKELEGKIETVADLAKMTELEVNRLCIKAPKVKVAKKVLNDYAAKKATEIAKTSENIIVLDPVIEKISIEVQTNEVLTKCSEMQTAEIPTLLAHTQTDMVPLTHNSAQTNESGSKSTKDIITTCLTERPDFVDRLKDQLDISSVQQISDKLPFDATLEVLKKKMTASNLKEALDCILTQSARYSSKDKCESLNLSILQDYLCKKFDSKDLILFCSQLLQNIHDKNS